MLPWAVIELPKCPILPYATLTNVDTVPAWRVRHKISHFVRCQINVINTRPRCPKLMKFMDELPKLMKLMSTRIIIFLNLKR